MIHWKALGMSIIVFIFIIIGFLIMAIAPILFLKGIACLMFALFLYSMLKVSYIGFKDYFERKSKGEE